MYAKNTDQPKTKHRTQKQDRKNSRKKPAQRKQPTTHNDSKQRTTMTLTIKQLQQIADQRNEKIHVKRRPNSHTKIRFTEK
jgi:hypothetical protein